MNYVKKYIYVLRIHWIIDTLESKGTLSNELSLKFYLIIVLIEIWYEICILS